VTTALNAFTLAVAGVALLTSLLTLANSRLPQLAPLWALGVTRRRLASGAGHDAMAIASLCDVGMIFVRCKGGISHNPAESITEADAEIGARVLYGVLRKFQPRDATPPRKTERAPG